MFEHIDLGGKRGEAPERNEIAECIDYERIFQRAEQRNLFIENEERQTCEEAFQKIHEEGACDREKKEGDVDPEEVGFEFLKVGKSKQYPEHDNEGGHVPKDTLCPFFRDGCHLFPATLLYEWIA